MRWSAWQARAVVIVLLLITGVAIEVSLDRGFVRFTVGDIVVAAMIYLLLRAAPTVGPARAAILGLIVTFSVEAAQALQLVDRFGMPRNRLTEVILGTTFTWGDLAAYSVGIAAAFSFDRLLDRTMAKDDHRIADDLRSQS